jgi:hypothetical protein
MPPLAFRASLTHPHTLFPLPSLFQEASRGREIRLEGFSNYFSLLDRISQVRNSIVGIPKTKHFKQGNQPITASSEYRLNKE